MSHRARAPRRGASRAALSAEGARLFSALDPAAQVIVLRSIRLFDRAVRKAQDEREPHPSIDPLFATDAQRSAALAWDRYLGTRRDAYAPAAPVRRAR